MIMAQKCEVGNAYGRLGAYPDKVMQLNEDLIKHDLKNFVHNGVEENLNALLDKEADELVNEGKYKSFSNCQGYRSGRYKRSLYKLRAKCS